MKKTILFLLVLLTSIATQATDLAGIKIYINPGHGGYDANDRSIWTIPVPETWTNPAGYWESKSNLVKGLALRDMLEAAGATVIMSRLENTSGIRDTSYYQSSPGVYRPGVDVAALLVGGDRDLSAIAEEANANNVDHFLSIHSNAINNATNYLLLLFRGTDTNPTIAASLPMARNSGPIQFDNPLTVWTNTSINIRGDLSFYADGWGLGVLRPLTVPGFLSEGSFHDYPPETHRLCNDDYCKLEAIRFFQHFHSYYNRDLPMNGTIAGWVKSKNENIEVPKFTYKAGSDDQWLPINGATVELLDAAGTTVLQTYTTDNWYNGIYAFYNVVPGNYKVRANMTGYDEEIVDVSLAASQIAYAKVRLLNLNYINPDTDVDYPDPDQEAGIVALNNYDFETILDPVNPSWLSSSDIKRVLFRDEKLYVLTTDPKILVVDAKTAGLIKELDLTGTENLNDIAFSADGYLMACNKETVPYQSTTTYFKVFTWDDDDAAPTLLFQSNRNGNFNSGIMGETFTVSGPRRNCKIYTPVVTAATPPTTTTHWRVEGLQYKAGVGIVAGMFKEGDAPYSLPYAAVGEHPIFMITPNGNGDCILIDSELMQPIEYKFDWTTAERTKLTKMADFAEVSGYTLPAIARGGNYFRNAGHSYMIIPVCETDGANVGVVLFDVNNGLNNAVKVSEKYPGLGLGATPASYMMAAGVVSGFDIDLLILAKNQGIARYESTTDDIPTANIYASELSITSAGAFKFTLNEDAQSVFIAIDKDGETLTSFNAGALAKGEHTIDNPFGDVDFNAWSITATARAVSHPVRVTENEAKFQFHSLRGVSVDNNPASPFFGRVYTIDSNYSSTNPTSIAGRKGVYIFNSLLEDVTNQSTVAYNGGVSWNPTSAASPMRVGVAPNGDVYITDWSDSPTSGVWVMNPAEPTAAFRPVFGGTVNTIGLATNNAIEIHGSISDCWITGTDDNTILYTFDEDAVAPGRAPDASTYIRGGNLFQYNIGSSTEPWVTAPSRVVYDDVQNGNLQKNGNSQIAPDGRGGWWISQYRAEGDAATPTLIHVTSSGTVDYNSATAITATYQGGMAVTEDGSRIAIGGSGNVRIYNIEFGGNNVPVLSLAYTLTHNNSYTYSCAFDVSGNLYIAAANVLSMWSLPKADNSYTTRVTIPLKQYTLTVNNGIGSGDYTAGTVVDISADDAPTGQTFDQWTGDISGVADVNAASTTYTMENEDATITATYKDLPSTYTLTVNNGTGSGDYTAGTIVDISADAAPTGQSFDQWIGDISGVADVNAENTTYTMESADATITATYKNLPPMQYSLTVNNGTGSGDYTAGTVVDILANVASEGQMFDQWTGDVSGIADVNAENTTYTMGSTDATITATYKDLPPTLYSLTVNNGTGGGDYATGTVVDISADDAPEGYIFDQWTGDVSGIADVNAENTTYTMESADATITATYKNLTLYILTVNNGIGSGNYTASTVVNISANNAPTGQIFDKWIGDVWGVADVNAASTTYTMGSLNAMITATYKNMSTYTVTFALNVPDAVVTLNGITNPAGDYVFTEIKAGTYTYIISREGYEDVIGTVIVSDGDITITLDLYTGIESIESGIKIYTENSSLRIESSVAMTSVEIYNLSGQAIRLIRVDNNQVRIDNLPKGILIVKVSLQGGKLETEKVWIK